MLGDFFDKVDHGFDFLDKALPAGDDLAYTWPDELAPTFYGTSTSPPQQQQQASLNGIQGISYSSTNGHLELMPNEMPSTASEEVLVAATLLHNGHGHVHPSHMENPLFSAQDMSHQLMGPPSTSRSEGLQSH